MGKKTVTNNKETLGEQLTAFGEDIIQRRMDRLKRRRFVLFPWLRFLLLARKYKKLKNFKTYYA